MPPRRSKRIIAAAGAGADADPAVAPAPKAKKSKGVKSGRVTKAKGKATGKGKAKTAPKSKKRKDDKAIVDEWNEFLVDPDNQPQDADFWEKFESYDDDGKKAILKTLVEEKVIRQPEGHIKMTKNERERSCQIYHSIHGKARWPPNFTNHGCGHISQDIVAVDEPYDGRFTEDFIKHDAYCLRGLFTQLWGALKEQPGAARGGPDVTWTDQRWFLDDNDFLCVDNDEGNEDGSLETSTNLMNRLGRCIHSDDKDYVLKDPSLHLLHRMMVTFGAQPTVRKAPNYPTAWCYVLWNRGDKNCELHIGDKKGKPFAEFYGEGATATANNQALQLLEWLSGEDCPLTPNTVLWQMK